MSEEKNATCCPVARGLEKVGDAWSMLILRDLSLGLRRFEELRVSLRIAPNILTARLRALGEAGLVEKRRYSERPPRDEYVLTGAGRDFLPVLHVIGEWGRRHNGEGGTSRLVDTETNALVEPMVVDRLTGKPLADAKLRLAQPDDPLVSGAAPKRSWLLD
ncbi:MAG TPA: helix-turn-helix domain-containing protein [Sphingomonas sp.]|nr:helix-turn-helix domain-containing protein [Sphingomonas sp.]